MDSTNPNHSSLNTPSADPLPRCRVGAATSQLGFTRSTNAITTTTTASPAHQLPDTTITPQTSTTFHTGTGTGAATAKPSFAVPDTDTRANSATSCELQYVSSSLVEGTILWPKARLAFLVLDLTSVCNNPGNISLSNPLDHSIDGDVINRLDRFMSRHPQCHVILTSGLFTAEQFKVVSLLNQRFIGSKTDFLVAHHAEDCVNAMVTIVKLQVPPNSNRQHARFCDLMTELMTIPN